MLHKPLHSSNKINKYCWKTWLLAGWASHQEPETSSNDGARQAEKKREKLKNLNFFEKKKWTWPNVWPNVWLNVLAGRCGGVVDWSKKI
jgi:hypothetical protein